jgi:hypothetical protein
VILDLEVEQTMASKYRLSGLIPDVFDKTEKSHNITDKTLVDYEQQLIMELKNQNN